MQLEKASGHSGGSGLAGWISTNDVTLFTMVLVVLIALALHTSLVKKRKSNEELTLNLTNTSSERDSLDAELRKRREELAAQGQTLEQIEASLQVTQGERDQINKDLQTTQQLVASLQASIEGLQAEKLELSESRTRQEAQASELSELTKQLTTEKLSLTEQLEKLGGQLVEKIDELKAVEQTRTRLNEQVGELDAIIATLESKLDAANLDMSKIQEQHTEEKTKAKARITELEELAREKGVAVEDYLAKLRRATEVIEGLQVERANIEEQLTAAELRYEQQLLKETTVNRELVGVKGKLNKVAIIFDASGSMKEAATDSTGDRWSEAQEIAKTWLQYLNVDECVLIVFSSNVRTFPADGGFADLRGDEGAAVRRQLLDELTKVEPEGWTNTLGALRTAYRYEGLDSIVLLSDGAPTNPNLGEFDQGVADSIYDLCRQYPDIPVNTIGLGNYFDEDLATFLRSVARITGGTFRGR